VVIKIKRHTCSAFAIRFERKTSSVGCSYWPKCPCRDLRSFQVIDKLVEENQLKQLRIRTCKVGLVGVQRCFVESTREPECSQDEMKATVATAVAAAE